MERVLVKCFYRRGDYIKNSFDKNDDESDNERIECDIPITLLFLCFHSSQKIKSLVGRTGLKRVIKKTNFTKSHKEQEFVESYDRPRLEGTRHRRCSLVCQATTILFSIETDFISAEVLSGNSALLLFKPIWPNFASKSVELNVLKMPFIFAL